MLKVLLVDDTSHRASSLKDALGAMEGVVVTCTLESALALSERVNEHRPDIVLIDAEPPGRDVLAQLAAMARPPMVLFTEKATRQLRSELDETRMRLAERKFVERAKGILMKQRGASEDEAFAALRSLAMQKGIRLGDAARQVIEVASLLG
jgi:two-component system, response regulator / RNA-binding antiterminator